MSCIPRTIDSLQFQATYGSVFRLTKIPYLVPIWGMDLTEFTLYGSCDEYTLKDLRNNHDGTYLFEFHSFLSKVYVIYHSASGDADVIVYRKKWFSKDKLVSQDTFKMIRELDSDY